MYKWHHLFSGMHFVLVRMLCKPAMASCAGIMLLLLTLPAATFAASTPLQDIPPASQTLLSSTLMQFMPNPGPINLHGGNSQKSLSLPIAKRMRIDKAILHLVATNSVSLLKPPSQLRIMLDGQVVAQIHLSPDLPEIRADIALPTALLTQGYRTLTFAAGLRYTEDCQDSSDPSLWVQINTGKSWMELRGGLNPDKPKLSMLDDVFDPKLWGPASVDIMMPGNLSASHLEWGDMAAQAVSLRYGYKPVKFQVENVLSARQQSGDSTQQVYLNPEQVRSSTAILIGTQHDLAPYLGEGLRTKINGPFLGIYPLGTSHTHLVLVISGKDNKEVFTALKSILYLNMPYMDEQSMTIDGVQATAIPGRDARNLVFPGQSISFSDLGLHSHTFRFLDPGSTLTFKLPAGLYAPVDAMADLHLRFAYGAEMRKDSDLNIYVNGKFFRAIALDVNSGGYFTDYRLGIPLQLLHAGTNQIRFTTAMMPLVSGKCGAINTRNLLFTLFGTSTLTLPNAGYINTLPDLSLLGDQIGFPYATGEDGGQFDVILPHATTMTASAAIEFIAKLTQVRGLPLPDVHFYSAMPQPGKLSGNMLLVGTADNLPTQILKGGPLALGPHTQAPYSVSLPTHPVHVNWIEGVWNNLRHAEQPSAPTKHVIDWVSQQGNGLGQQGLLMQYESPFSKGKVVTVLTAANASTLLSRSHELIQSGLWSQLDGNIDTWKNQDSVVSQQVGPTFTVGESSVSLRLSYTFSRYPLVLEGVISVLAIFFVLVLLRLLMRFRHRHLRGVREEVPSDIDGKDDE